MSKNKFDTANKKLINAGELISKYKLKRAKELIKEALELFKEINTHLMIAQCYYKLGIIYEIEGKWDKAEKYYFKSLEIRKEYGTSFKVADMNRLISRLFIFQKKWDKALQHAQIAFDILENDKDTYNERDHPLVQGESLFLLGTVYFQQNNYSSANFYYKLGLNKIHYNLNPTLFLDLKENLAHLYYKTGNYLKSINIYYEILDIEHQNKNHPVIINILLSLTMNFFHTNNIKKMRNLMVDANDIYNSIYNEIKENDTFLFNYNYKSGVIYRKLKNYIRGHEYAEKAIEIGDKLNDSNSKNKYENKSNKNKIYTLCD